MLHDTARARCLALPAATEDQPFGEGTLVFRVGGKIFALLALDERPARLNLKCDPEEAADLRERYACVLPGYHMNKAHWNTVVLDGSVAPAEVGGWIEASYRLVRASLAKRVQAALDAAPEEEA